MSVFELNTAFIDELLFCNEWKKGNFADSAEFDKNQWSLLELTKNNSLRKIEKVLNLEQPERRKRIGHWELDIINNDLYWTREIFDLLELHPDAISEVSYETFLKFIHPEDKERVNEVYWGSVKNKTLYMVAHRMIINNKTKYVIEKGRTLYKDGLPLKSVGIAYDVTGL